MASWIIHLRIAEAIQREKQYLSYEYFLIGNVAPDSGKLNEDKSGYTPSTTVSHFVEDSNIKWKCEELRYYRSYIANNFRDIPLTDEQCFHYGYFTHLIVDLLWAFFIYEPVKHRLEKEFQEDPLYAWEIKKDWYGLDAEYLLENSHWETWKVFENAHYNLNCLEFYPKENIQLKLEEIKNFYQVERGFARPNKYLLKQDWELFIKVASKLVLNVLDNVRDIEQKYSKSSLEYLEEKYAIFNGVFGDINEAAKEIQHSI